MQYLLPFTQRQCQQLVTHRAGETKLAQTILTHKQDTSLEETLNTAKNNQVRFVIIGIGEDIGPRANLGRGGASDAFESAMAQFLNLQSNRFFNGKQCLVLGQIKTDDLQLAEGTSADVLRANVESLDKRVIEITAQVMAAGFEPIVIGGGHNNAYGLLMAAKQAYNKPIAAVNLDPHSDFRPREGRHSGNGFSYAAASGALGYYHILGMHELKNSEETLSQLSAFGGHWHTLQSIWVRREISLTAALEEIVIKLNNSQLPVALELDLDAITNMPSSASTAAGIPLIDALHYVHTIAKNTACSYLHLAEAAPSCHVAGVQAGYRETGQSISELIYAYIQARTQAQKLAY
ncbi:formimidoylglutamase [Shewanella sp. D64]|uniref:formimidoylglutamase n=1 Tax=unclassified Shewanella TaxID=196818 RepID=UPI0022BA4B37|nr:MULTISPECIES: formimidoylglutamase [unclassified Shewanella]MEC4726139.1 formimidoylglutamase [Shewanella sp. D64]MEC4737945.1 formimidoylglutamase [Shewanella sp. E94]WBJ96146.1 formimidoylglutamase [Shewanella sp. MTB7]